MFKVGDKVRTRPVKRGSSWKAGTVATVVDFNEYLGFYRLRRDSDGETWGGVFYEHELELVEPQSGRALVEMSLEDWMDIGALVINHSKDQELARRFGEAILRRKNV